jgi:hypothetical protein
MKQQILLLCLLILSQVFFIKCKESNLQNIPEKKAITAEVSWFSECLSNSPELFSTPDTLSCVKYSFDITTQTLQLKHFNSAFNCCPDEIFTEIIITNDSIIIEEKERTAMCDCLCLFDLTTLVKNIENKNYTVVIREPYIDEEQPFAINTNFYKSPTGEICITRNKYPWGITVENK